MRDPDIEELIGWVEAAKGRIGKVTLAPEKLGAIEFIRTLKNMGIVVAIGHTIS